jgi:hypothetical protein
MTMLEFLKLYGVGAVVCFGLDLVWLGVVARGFYRQHLGYIMRPDVQWVPAVLFYLIYVAALVVFVVMPAVEKQSLARALLLGAFFVVCQGREWVQLLGEGLTLTSSALGSFFYLIVGMHAIHAVVALGILAYAWNRLRRGFLPSGVMGAAEVFWYFVVGIWPLLYWRIYL